MYTRTSSDDDVLPNNAKLTGYNEPFVSNTLTSKGGVAIFAKTPSATERTDLKIQDVEFEGIWIEIPNSRSKNTIVGCLYRHPHNNNTESFFDYLNKCLAQLNKENKEVYISGDFNLDLLKYENKPIIRDFYNLMTSNGYLPLITQPTRLRDNSQSLIDNIFTNTFTHESYSGNILIEFADHLTQFATVRRKQHYPKIEPYYKLDQSKFDEKSFLEDLSLQNFKCSDDPNELFNDILWKYEACVKRHMPLKKMTNKEEKKSNKPWITNEILKKIKHRNSLFAKKKKDPQNAHLKSAYNRFRNSVNNDIKSSKKDYYSRYFENCKNNMKKTWKGINDIIRSNKKSTYINGLRIQGGVVGILFYKN